MVVLPEDSWFMVQRGDRHYKCLGSELRNFIQMGDKFLMQRDDTKHAITVDWLPTPSKDAIKPPDPPASAVPPDPNITVPDFTFGISGDVQSVGRDVWKNKPCIQRITNPHGVWDSYAITYSKNTQRSVIYYNGVNVKEMTHSVAPENAASDPLILFGFDPDNGAYRAATHQWFRSFRYYGTTLNSKQVRANYVRDQDFSTVYRPPIVPGCIVSIDARASRLVHDTSKNFMYIENLIDGNQDQFWWTDGTKSSNGVTDPNTYIDVDDVNYIWKINENKTGSDGGWINSTFAPDIHEDFTFEFTFNPLSIGYGTDFTWLAASATGSWTNIEVVFEFNGCSPIEYP